MAKFKFTFNTYKNADEAAKSFINFMMKNGLLCLLSDNGHSWIIEHDLQTGVNCTAVSDDSNNYTVELPEITDHEDPLPIALLSGALVNESSSDEDPESYERVQFRVFRVNETNQITINAKSNGYTNFVGTVLRLPVQCESQLLTGNIRLPFSSGDSGYDISIPMCDLTKTELPQYAVNATADLNPHLQSLFVACSAMGEEGNGTKLIFSQVDPAEGKIQIKCVDADNNIVASSEQLNESDINTYWKIENISVTLTDNPEENSTVGNFFKLRFINKGDGPEWLTFDFTDGDIVFECKNGISESDNLMLRNDTVYDYPILMENFDSGVQVFKTHKFWYRDNATENEGPTEFAFKEPLLNIPVNVEFISNSTDEDKFPYSLLLNSVEKFQIDGGTLHNEINLKEINVESNPINYTLRTTSFTISDSYYDYTSGDRVTDKTDVYYKIGILSLDTQKSSTNELINKLKNLNCFTTVQISNGKSDIPVIAMMPSEQSLTEQEHYSIRDDTPFNEPSMISISSGWLPYSIVNVTALPLIRVTNDSKELKGIIYMQLCNSNGEEINQSYASDGTHDIDILVNEIPSDAENTIQIFNIIDHDIDSGFIPSSTRQLVVDGDTDPDGCSLSTCNTTKFRIDDIDKLTNHGYWSFYWVAQNVPQLTANNFAGLETTATYDSNTDTFTLLISNGTAYSSNDNTLSDFTMEIMNKTTGTSTTLIFELYATHVPGSSSGMPISPASWSRQSEGISLSSLTTTSTSTMTIVE